MQEVRRAHRLQYRGMDRAQSQVVVRKRAVKPYVDTRHLSNATVERLDKVNRGKQDNPYED